MEMCWRELYPQIHVVASMTLYWKFLQLKFFILSFLQSALQGISR